MKKSLTYPRDVSRGAARASCSNLGNSCFIDANLFKRYLSEVSRIFVRNLSEMKKKVSENVLHRVQQLGD